MTRFIKLVGLKLLRMPNCSIEPKQKVVPLYHKGYSLFSTSTATSVPKSNCWDIVRRYNSRRHVKNQKTPDGPKNLDSTEEKQLINLLQNDPNKNLTQLLWQFNPKKLLHTFDTKNINLSFACQTCYQETLSYGEKIDFQKSLGK